MIHKLTEVLTSITHLVPTIKTLLFELSLVVVLILELWKVFSGMIGAD